MTSASPELLYLLESGLILIATVIFDSYYSAGLAFSIFVYF
jgi:hypothetical protein